MFAVPGWSVSADLLKRQTGKSKKEKSRSKKRKLSEDNEAVGQETSSRKLPKNSHDKTQKGGKPGVDEGTKKYREEGRPTQKTGLDPSQRQREKPDRQSQRTPKQRKSSENGEKPAAVETAAKSVQEVRAPSNNAAPKPTQGTQSDVKLTPLQSAMRAKLMGSRFRHLNESLYTKPSAESMELFSQNPNFFDEYHTGFRQQVSTWPENPVDSFFTELQQRSKVQAKDRKLDANQVPPGHQSFTIRPLPRTQGRCNIADLGCGHASLAKKVRTLGKQAKVTVDSYDLQSSEPGVIKADIASLPAKSDSVNVAVFCLALMGTNWIEFIEEAWRILHWKGELWIAEIKSRFSNKQRKPPNHSVGKKRKLDKQDMKKQKQQEEQEEAERTIAEMDGKAEHSASTDVSGFVAVLQKRGFDLADEQSVDLSNKMFVRMKFVKSRSPVKGKYTGQGGKTKNWREMLREGLDDGQDESAILQPCLYKVR